MQKSRILKNETIAIISDIHANLLALNEVLNDIKRKEIHQIYCLGDLVDFAPWGNEVIELIRDSGIPCVLGNHDERVAHNLPVVPLSHHGMTETRSRQLAIRLSKDTITNDNKRWLSGLPFQLELTFKTGRKTRKVMLVHASPRSNDEYIFESDSKDDLLGILNDREIDALVMGHTHISYIQRNENKLLINCGSVGRSKEIDRKATYSILAISDEHIEAEICKIDYPIAEVAEAIYKSDIPDFYANFILSGK